MEQVCPECGQNIWPTTSQLVAWARLRGKTIGDSAWLAVAAFLFWVFFPPLGLVLNIAARHGAWLARRLWLPVDGDTQRHRAQILLKRPRRFRKPGRNLAAALLSSLGRIFNGAPIAAGLIVGASILAGL